MWQHPGTLTGQVVRLEPLAPDHLDGLWLASRDPRTWRWLSIVQPQTRAGLEEWLDAALAGPDHPFATVLAASGEVVGSTRFLSIREPDRSVEIGWTWLATTAWGTGANFEAKLLMLEHAFERWQCRRVELKTDALNQRSRAAILRIGAREEGTFRKHMITASGRIRDTVYYAIVDDDWPAVKANLTQRLAR